MDQEIVTLEIPNSLVTAWEKHPDFISYHQEFLGRHPPAKSFKKDKKPPKPPSAPKLLSKKRRLAPSLESSIVGLDEVKVPDGEELLCEVPLVNARAGKKLSTLPMLCISKSVGPFIKNESGHEVTWLLELVTGLDSLGLQ